MTRSAIFLTASLALFATVASPAIAGETRQAAMAGAGGTQLSDVGSASLMDRVAWSEITIQEVELGTAPPVHDSIVGQAATTRLRVQGVKTEDGVYFRLQWSDEKPDEGIDDIDRFADGVAIQFAVEGAQDTPILMGDNEHPVNIWYWNAAKQRAENLFAYGFGSLAPVELQDVEAAGKYEDGKWTVVFYRSLTSTEEGVMNFAGSIDIPVAFAVWNGSNRERDGFKAASLDWQTFGF